jgi:hypothetical protein
VTWKYAASGVTEYPAATPIQQIREAHPRAAIIRLHINGAGWTVFNQPMDAIGHWSAALGAKQEAA